MELSVESFRRESRFSSSEKGELLGSCVVGRVAEELRGWRGEGPNHEGHGPATRARAGTSPVPHAGGTRGAVTQRDDALREVATPISFHWVFV